MKNNNILHNPFVAILVALVAPFTAFAFGVGSIALSTPQHTLTTIHPTSVSVTKPLEAKAAVIYDPQTGRILYQKNANQPLPLASLTKLMTAQTVLSLRDPHTPVTVTAADVSTEGDSGLRAGQTLSLDELLSYGLVSSSNDAVAAAAASLGPDYLDQMNTEAATLGLTKTYFLNPTGLDQSTTTAGAYGSAYDVARLAAAFFLNHPHYFEKTARANTLNIEDSNLAATATAEPLFDIPGLIGGKTGYTDLAGGNLVVAFDLEIGYPVVAAVLGSGHEGRFEDIRTLIEATRTNRI